MNMLKRSISVCLVFVLVFVAGAVYAFDANQLQTLKSTTACSRCDLSFANLSGTTLFRKLISDSNFSFAIMPRIDMGYIVAVNANFYGANLAGSKFPYANLTGANLSGANLHGSYLGNAILTGANLSNANLYLATLTNANLTGANLTGANLSGAAWVDGAICKTPSIGTCIK
jgi:uncharacterized protein YjbI with pentapeptide repeats